MIEFELNKYKYLYDMLNVFDLIMIVLLLRDIRYLLLFRWNIVLKICLVYF